MNPFLFLQMTMHLYWMCIRLKGIPALHILSLAPWLEACPCSPSQQLITGLKWPSPGLKAAISRCTQLITHKGTNRGKYKASSWTLFTASSPVIIIIIKKEATGCGEWTSNAKDSEEVPLSLSAGNEHGDPIKARTSGSRSCFSMPRLSVDSDTDRGSHLPVILSP